MQSFTKQLLQVFESWGGELSPKDFAKFSLPYLKDIATRVKAALGARSVPMVVFARGSHYALESLLETEYDIISLDWTMDPAQARARTQSRVVLQGNADPCILYADEPAIREHVRDMFTGFGIKSKYIANLGHGMHPDHDPEHLKMYLQAIVSLWQTS